jgi:hypothetical protein
MSKELITSILDESEIERIKTLDKLLGEIVEKMEKVRELTDAISRSDN